MEEINLRTSHCTVLTVLVYGATFILLNTTTSQVVLKGPYQSRVPLFSIGYS